MAEMLKHIGMLENTGKNVVVVFMSLPNDEENALVIDTDALPDQYNEALRRIVESTEGQQAKDLADILGRRPSPDGSSQTMLQKLHVSQRLMKVPVDIVHMTPRRGMKFPLRSILDQMKKNDSETPADLNDLDPVTRAQVIAEMGKFNVHKTNMEGTTADGQAESARNLIRMAEMLEADAVGKRAQAYAIDPSLNPARSHKPATEAAKLTTKAEAKVATKAVAAATAKSARKPAAAPAASK
jgi:hypothetical protein